MFLTVLLFFIATFGLVSSGVIGYRFVMERRIFLGKESRGVKEGYEWIEPADLLKTESLSTITFWDRFLTRIDYVNVMRDRLAEADLKWSVGRLTAFMLLLGTLTFAVLMRLNWATFYTSIMGACLVALIPYLYVLGVRRKRLERFESQFPDAMDSLSRALRAGHPLAAGLQMLVYEAPEPLAGEMRTTAEERNLGSSWEQALDNLAVRVPLVEVSIFTAAIKLQSRTGGRLSEVLGRLSESMRESHALKSEIRSIAAHGKLTGRVLMTLPIAITIMMSMVNPDYLMTLWVHPLGKDLIAATVVSLILAQVVIGKMVDIKI